MFKPAGSTGAYFKALSALSITTQSVGEGRSNDAVFRLRFGVRIRFGYCPVCARRFPKALQAGSGAGDGSRQFNAPRCRKRAFAAADWTRREGWLPNFARLGGRPFVVRAFAEINEWPFFAGSEYVMIDLTVHSS